MNKRSFHFFVAFIFLIVISLGWLFCQRPGMPALKTMGSIGLLQLAFTCWSWKRLQGNMINPYCLFVVAAYLFTFGQSLLYPFDLVSPQRDLLNSYVLPFSFQDIFNSQLLTLLFLNFMHIGAICALKPASQVSLNSEHPVSSALERPPISHFHQLYGIKLVGWGLFAISFLPFFVKSFTEYGVVKSYGYGAIYEQEVHIGLANINYILSSYFIPSILCLLVAYHTSRRAKFFFLGILLLDIIFTLFIGGRTQAVILASVVLLVQHNLIRPLKWKELLFVGLSAYLFLGLLSVISEVRSNSHRTFSDYSSNTGEVQRFTSPITETFSEMGSSMMPLAATMQLVPQVRSHRYGSTFFYSLTTIIPNLGFWDIHPGKEYATLGDWLQRELQLGYGPGYSIVAEAYLNFGIFGFFFMLLYGFVLARIFRSITPEISKNHPLQFLLVILFCQLGLATVRNSFIAIVRTVFYYLLVVYAGVTILNRHKSKTASKLQ